MPHILVDYSANMEDRTDIAALCHDLRRAAARTGVFPPAGIRVRAFRADHVAIADGADRHGYVHVVIRLRAGRTLEARKAAAAQVFEAAQRCLAPAMAVFPVALSLEMVDMDPELSPKISTIRDHLPEDRA